MIAPPCLPYRELIVPEAVPSEAVPAPVPAAPMKKPSVVAEPETKPTPPRTAAEALPGTTEAERIRPVGGLDGPTGPIKLPMLPKADGPKVPAPIPKLPGGDGLPPLAVPTPADPSGKVNANYPAKPARVRIVAVAGTPTSAATGLIGFFNRSQTDLTLTVNGTKTAFPKQSYLSVELPRKFTWSLDDGAEQTTDVPAEAPGVEIVIRY